MLLIRVDNNGSVELLNEVFLSGCCHPFHCTAFKAIAKLGHTSACDRKSATVGYECCFLNSLGVQLYFALKTVEK